LSANIGSESQIGLPNYPISKETKREKIMDATPLETTKHCLSHPMTVAFQPFPSQFGLVMMGSEVEDLCKK